MFSFFNIESLLFPPKNFQKTFGEGNPDEEHEHSRSFPSLTVKFEKSSCAPLHVMSGFVGLTVKLKTIYLQSVENVSM